MFRPYRGSNRAISSGLCPPKSEKVPPRIMISAAVYRLPISPKLSRIVVILWLGGHIFLPLARPACQSGNFLATFRMARGNHKKMRLAVLSDPLAGGRDYLLLPFMGAGRHEDGQFLAACLSIAISSLSGVGLAGFIFSDPPICRAGLLPEFPANWRIYLPGSGQRQKYPAGQKRQYGQVPSILPRLRLYRIAGQRQNIRGYFWPPCG